MVDTTFSRFVYPDTNILGIIADDLTKWKPLQDFLHGNDLCIALSIGQASELSDVRRLHQNLNTILTAVPTIITKTPDEILEQEVNFYPKVRKTNIVGGYLNEFFMTDRLEEFLSSGDLAAARVSQRETSFQMPSRLEELKQNFPPRYDGTYDEDQADEFVFKYTLQQLSPLYLSFLSKFRENASELNIQPFLSLAITGYVIFYKYCIHGKNPIPSDFGDLFHLFVIPYCELALLERDLCNVLNHIKKNHTILDNTIVKNVEFFNDWFI